MSDSLDPECSMLVSSSVSRCASPFAHLDVDSESSIENPGSRFEACESMLTWRERDGAKQLSGGIREARRES